MDQNEGVAALYQQACPPLIGLLTVLGGSRTDAEEVAHDAFVKLIDHWRTVGTYDDPAAWVRTVAVRLLISRRRRFRVAQRGLRRMSAGEPLSVPALGGESVDLERAMASLSVHHRAVLVLHHACDLPLDEVAEILGLPVGTVKSRLSRARAALSPMLSDLEGSDHV